MIPPPKFNPTQRYMVPNPHGTYVAMVPNAPKPGWTFGTGAVIWRIWPAVLVHTVFSAVIVIISHETPYNLAIPNIMMTIIGVVIGFVISYRVSSGYDRYWWGRCYWSDIVRNCRTMGRLIWYHVPARITTNKAEVTQEEIKLVTTEKKMALDLLQGFAVAVKHHLRGEMGPYFEDLYYLIQSMEQDPYHTHQEPLSPSSSSVFSGVANHVNRRRSPSCTPPHVLIALPDSPTPAVAPNPYHEYGTFENSGDGETRPLLPSMPLRSHRVSVASELIPFSSIASGIYGLWQRFKHRHDANDDKDHRPEIYKRVKKQHRPRLAGGGLNLPVDILHAISEWFAKLEDRGTVPGTSMGPMINSLAAMEDSLSGLERILTTPLPFVYSVHIRHTVWMYLFFLPFQLTDPFGYLTIPGVAIAAFFFLGFLAAGEEIEQPFGNDENDLDLDMFCRDIIHMEVSCLAKSPTPNSYFGHPMATLTRPAYGGSVVDAARKKLVEDGDDDEEGLLMPVKFRRSTPASPAQPFVPPAMPATSSATNASSADAGGMPSEPMIPTAPPPQVVLAPQVVPPTPAPAPATQA